VKSVLDAWCNWPRDCRPQQHGAAEGGTDGASNPEVRDHENHSYLSTVKIFLSSQDSMLLLAYRGARKE